MNSNNLQENTILIFGSGIMSLIYYGLDFLQISKEQVLSLIIIFSISSFISMFKHISLKLSILQFLIIELISKASLVIIPFVFAIAAVQVPVLYYFVDYVFSLIIIGEVLSILISIQSIRTRRLIDDVDLYNLFLLKFKKWIYKFLKLKDLNEVEKNNFDLWLEEQMYKKEKSNKEAEEKNNFK